MFNILAACICRIKAQKFKNSDYNNIYIQLAKNYLCKSGKYTSMYLKQINQLGLCGAI